MGKERTFPVLKGGSETPVRERGTVSLLVHKKKRKKKGAEGDTSTMLAESKKEINVTHYVSILRGKRGGRETTQSTQTKRWDFRTSLYSVPGGVKGKRKHRRFSFLILRTEQRDKKTGGALSGVTSSKKRNRFKLETKKGPKERKGKTELEEKHEEKRGEGERGPKKGEKSRRRKVSLEKTGTNLSKKCVEGGTEGEPPHITGRFTAQTQE